MIFANFLYIILALLGLGFLIFIHELGHYFMAKKEKMKIETFSIGFGKPFISWKRKNVKWQICILPFGGYVKIAGMQKEKGKEPHQIKDGFFSKRPGQRIRVSLMGPLVNVIFAFLAFTVIWYFGGRNVPFSQFTKKIGYVNPNSELYSLKVRAGDEIVKYANQDYKGFEDIIMSSISDKKEINVQGYKINYSKKFFKVYFDYTLPVMHSYLMGVDAPANIGIEAPASYLIYVKGAKMINPFLKYSQLQDNDRVLWVNGEIVFSHAQLSSILNDESVFLTVRRGSKTVPIKVKLVKITDLKISKEFKNELDDWKHYQRIEKPLNELKIIPYTFTEEGLIEGPIKFIDAKETDHLFDNRNIYDVTLKTGDRILAIDGSKCRNASQVLYYMQNPQVLLIVQRDPLLNNVVSYKDIDEDFNQNLNVRDLETMVASIGTDKEMKNLNQLYLLDPFRTITQRQARDINKDQAEIYLKQKQKIKRMKDLQKRDEILKILKKESKSKIIGIALRDRKVKYNPNPAIIFVNSFKNIYKTFVSLVSGYVSPKHLAGPIGIIQVMQHSWSQGILDALYFLGFISLNLGIINLLPVPALDGGHIIFAIVEKIRKKPLKAKTMEKLILPFIILLIGLMIFFLYNDIARIIKNIL